MIQIFLPPEIEVPLTERARQQGTTPELLAIDSLRRMFVNAPDNGENVEGQTLFEFLGGYIGTISGSGEAFSEKCGERFAEHLVEKHKRTSP